ncbi:hypothetical protein LBYZC6_07580 [Lacrimispora brassicae]
MCYDYRFKASGQTHLGIVSIPVTMEGDHNYFGIAIYGSKKKVNKLTGFMALLR